MIKALENLTGDICVTSTIDYQNRFKSVAWKKVYLVEIFDLSQF